jgi:hypothetical protein
MLFASPINKRRILAAWFRHGPGSMSLRRQVIEGTLIVEMPGLMSIGRGPIDLECREMSGKVLVRPRPSDAFSIRTASAETRCLPFLTDKYEVRGLWGLILLLPTPRLVTDLERRRPPVSLVEVGGPRPLAGHAPDMERSPSVERSRSGGRVMTGISRPHRGTWALLRRAEPKHLPVGVTSGGRHFSRLHGGRVLADD